MTGSARDSEFGPAVSVWNAQADAPVLIVCEHASPHIPAPLNDLGLTGAVLHSHIAWDPGAVGVARALSQALSAALVQGEISRLVYDCNRPPDAPDAVPAHSEVHDIPGNTGLTPRDRQARVDRIYTPFCNRLTQEIRQRRKRLELLVTVHSFTPVYRGARRAVELGILHGCDDRFARAMLAAPPEDFQRDIRLNEPYAAKDGVAHTLDKHGVSNGLLSVMLEIRNDLIVTEAEQTAWAGHLAPWLRQTLARLTTDDVA